MATYAGIDVSKDSLSVSLLVEGKQGEKFNIANTEEGVKSLIDKLPKGVHCTMEATGVYNRLSAYSLHAAGISVSVINPKQYAHFAQAVMQITKTDGTDAALLALYGQRMQPKLFMPSSDNMLIVNQKIALLNQIQKQMRMLKNLSHAFRHDVVQDGLSAQKIDLLLAELGKQASCIEKEIYKCSDEEFAKAMKMATSVKGIGRKTAAMLLAATGGMKNFATADQVLKFLGLAPVRRQSGKSFDYSPGICRTGNPHLRSIIYMCTWTAMRHNKACKEMYERLKAAGKPSKVALIAIAAKLIRQVFAVIKSGIPFDNNYMPKPLNTLH